MDLVIAFLDKREVAYLLSLLIQNQKNPITTDYTAMVILDINQHTIVVAVGDWGER